MEPVTVIFLTGLLSGVIIGDAFDPLGIHHGEFDKECLVKTTSIRTYNFEIKDYIENTTKVETCNTTTKVD